MKGRVITTLPFSLEPAYIVYSIFVSKLTLLFLLERPEKAKIFQLVLETLTKVQKNQRIDFNSYCELLVR